MNACPKRLSHRDISAMDTEPVFCEGIYNPKLTGWGLVNTAEGKIFDSRDEYWDLDDLNVKFWAYTGKPGPVEEVLNVRHTSDKIPS